MLFPVPPRIVGSWEILSVIGRGGIGTVYRGRHTATGMRAAVKLLGPAPAVDATSARRLAREFETLQQIVHPNVVRVYDAGVAEGYSWLAMELVEGLDLRTYLSPLAGEPILELSPVRMERRAPDPAMPVFDMDAWMAEPVTGAHELPEMETRADVAAIRAFADLMDEPETDPGPGGPWQTSPDLTAALREPDLAAGEEPEPEPPSAALALRLNRPERMARLRAVLHEVLGALQFVHERGYVHRDLKPSNIMVDDFRRARIMDFGLVKQLGEGSALTLNGRVVGTYRYMAPEQAAGQAVDARADLWSLGVILYELLAGRPPFCSHIPAELWREITLLEPPPIRELNPGADPRLTAAAERLLRKAPADRFPSARAVLDAVRPGA